LYILTNILNLYKILKNQKKLDLLFKIED
jgi:hypothetical protein